MQASSMTATNSNHSAQFAGLPGQEENIATSKQASKPQNQNDQGQNGNSQGQNVNNQGQNQNDQGQNVSNQGQTKDEVFKEALEKAKGERDNALHRMFRNSPLTRSSNGRGHRTPTNPLELRASLSQMIYEILTGRGIKAKQPQHVEGAEGWRDFNIFNSFGGIFGMGSMSFMERFQGMEGLQFEHFHMESETVSYQAQGVVNTADGRTINIDISMHMSRQFTSYMNISGGSAALVDPLVINYGGTAASLMGEKFSFDLTMNGEMDNLAVLSEGSGFLAIDRNGDGKINDGSELFGPTTGCGFSELRKYDTDGNGWIDANDEIFDKLVVWRRDADGNDIVKTLKELGIGAIFLGDISTEFSFTGENNETLGVMRSTSFFIKQCGGAGTLSHIDMAL